MTVTVVSRWKCLGRGIKPGCGAHGEGTAEEVDKAAEAHTEETGHATIAGSEARK